MQTKWTDMRLVLHGRGSEMRQGRRPVQINVCAVPNIRRRYQRTVSYRPLYRFPYRFVYRACIVPYRPKPIHIGSCCCFMTQVGVGLAEDGVDLSLLCSWELYFRLLQVGGVVGAYYCGVGEGDGDVLGAEEVVCLAAEAELLHDGAVGQVFTRHGFQCSAGSGGTGVHGTPMADPVEDHTLVQGHCSTPAPVVPLF